MLTKVKQTKKFIVLCQAIGLLRRLYFTQRLDKYIPASSSLPEERYIDCHYRRWLNNCDANLVHMPGTHLTAVWIDDPFI